MTGLSVEIAGLKLKNPIIAASGPLTRDGKTICRIAKYGIAAAVTKTICTEAARDIPVPHIIRIPNGILNCEKWSELDLETWLNTEFKVAMKAGIPIIASVSSLRDDPDEIAETVKSIEEVGVKVFELVSSGYSPERLPEIIRKSRKVSDSLLFTKIAVEVMSRDAIVELGRKLEEAGADAISISDSYGPCLSIDIETGEPRLGKIDGSGRISGPAIKPFTVYFVSVLASSLKVPIIGVGGILSWKDVIEVMMAGAKAVQICSAFLIRGPEVAQEILRGLESFLERKGYKEIDDIVGIALNRIKERIERGIEVTEKIPIVINEGLCNGCGLCARVCPYEALTVKEGKAVWNSELCRSCGLCTTTCPQGAISFKFKSD